MRAGTTLLFQAGGWPRGQRVAAQHAECIFVGAPTRNGLKRSLEGLSAGVQAAGRPADSVRVFAIFKVIVEATAALAEAKLQALMNRASYEGARTLLSGWTGIDLSRYQPVDSLEYVDVALGSLFVGPMQVQPALILRRLLEIAEIDLGLQAAVQGPTGGCSWLPAGADETPAQGALRIGGLNAAGGLMSWLRLATL